MNVINKGGKEKACMRECVYAGKTDPILSRFPAYTLIRIHEFLVTKEKSQ
jgi:hypothetical protein